MVLTMVRFLFGLHFHSHLIAKLTDRWEEKLEKGEGERGANEGERE